MSRDRPINAGVPQPQAQEQPPPQVQAQPPADAPRAQAPEPPPADAHAVGSAYRNQLRTQGARRGRQRVPGALKLVAGLVALALLFIVVAVIGGTGGGDPAEDAPAPPPVASTAPAEAETEATSEAAAELGFPTFATGNTTRVGGASPAANAAAVALAVFPSTTPAQRPAAVALAGEDDWAGAIAGAVLMSAPLRAPLLYGAGDRLPEPTADALAALTPRGSAEADGAAVIAIGDVAAPEGAKVIRAGGGSAAARAAAVARLRDRIFGAAPKHVVLAPEDPELAVPAAAWAARSGDPVLFSGAEQLPKPTRTAIKRHPKAPVFVLGPSSAISSSVVREIAALGPPVKRVAGEDPVTNAIALARYASGGFGWNVNDPGHGFVLARAESPLDAAAAAPLSASGTWGPLLLSDNAGSLPAELRSYFLDVKPGYTTNPTRAFYNHVWVIGDQEDIDVNQQAEVHELAELAKIGGEE